MARDKSTFRFKKFSIRHQNASMKVGTDGVLLGAWSGKKISPKNILDIGTGSGLIALMLAQRFPSAKITGIDLHDLSIKDAQYNADRFPLPHHISMLTEDFLAFQPKKTFDFIVSNPPYFSEALLSEKDDKNRVRHQVHLTMEKLVKHAKDILSENGMLALILPTKEMLATIETAHEYSLFPQRICNISSTIEQQPIRMMVEFSGFKSFPPEEDLLIIYEADRSYTEQYKDLTKDFYLHF